MLQPLGHRLLLWTCQGLGAVRRALSGPLQANVLAVVAIVLLLEGAEWTATELGWVGSAEEQTLEKDPDPAEQAGSSKRPDPEEQKQQKGAPVRQAEDGDPPGDSPGRAAAPDWARPDLVVAIWGFGLLLWWIARSRQRLVIEAFEDSSKGTAVEGVAGLSSLLAVEIATITELLGTVDSDDPIPAVPEQLAALDPAIEGTGMDALTQDSVSAESQFSLGPFKIPIGTILGIVSRIVRGPRLIGHVHADGARRTVTLQLVRGSASRAWVYQDVAEVADDGTKTWPPVADVVNDLACRVLAGEAMGGRVPHDAFEHLVAALRAYRTEARSGRKHRLGLQRAEHELKAAVTEHASFDLGFYNLGVVYSRLGQLDAADRAFLRSIEIDNQRWSAYYAMALDHYQRAIAQGPGEVAQVLLLKAVDFCERAARLAPDSSARAQVVNQKALALWQYAMQLDSSTAAYDSAKAALQAIALSWRALCRAELAAANARRRARARSFASTCLQNFALLMMVALRLTANATPGHSSFTLWIVRRRIVSSLLLARSLTPGVAEIHLYLGQRYHEQGRYGRAVAALRRASRVDPNSGEALALLARSLARHDLYDAVTNTYQRVLDSLATLEPDALAALVEAFETVEARHREIHDFLVGVPDAVRARGRIRAFAWIARGLLRAGLRLSNRRWGLLRAVNGELVPLLGQREAADAWLEKSIAPYRHHAERIRGLEAFRRDLAQACGDPVDFDRLQKLLEEKREAGLGWEAGEVARQLARARSRKGELAEAESALREAISLFESGQRSEVVRHGLYADLARTLRLEKELDKALVAAQRAVRLDPVSYYERNELGHCYWARQEFASAQTAWEQALPWSPNPADMYYWIGVCHLVQAGDYRERTPHNERLDRAILSFTAAIELYEDKPERRNEARFQMASALSQAGRHREAVAEMRALKNSGYCPLATTAGLANAHLQKDEPKQADLYFRELLEQVEPRLATEDPNARVEGPPTAEPESLAAGLLMGHLGRAIARAELELPLDEAEKDLAEARKALDLMPADSDSRRNWGATCDRIEGVILFKQDRVDEALPRLQASLFVSPGRDTHYYLARTLLRQTALHKKEDHTVALRMARHHCRQAEELDWNDELADEITSLKQDLAKAA